MKTWIKGGLWGAGIGLVGVLGYFLGKFFSLFIVLSYINIPNSFLISLLFLGKISLEIFYIGILTAPVVYFLIGALVGFIIQKIKNKKVKKKRW